MNTKTCLNTSIAVILAIFTIYIATNILIQDNKLEGIQLFEDSECIIGCWQGLQPSLTTIEELEIFLDTTTVLTANAEIISSYNGDTAYYLQYDNSTVGFFIRDDVLIEIYFHEILVQT